MFFLLFIIRPKFDAVILFVLSECQALLSDCIFVAFSTEIKATLSKGKFYKQKRDELH